MKAMSSGRRTDIKVGSREKGVVKSVGELDPVVNSLAWFGSCAVIAVQRDRACTEDFKNRLANSLQRFKGSVSWLPVGNILTSRQSEEVSNRALAKVSEQIDDKRGFQVIGFEDFSFDAPKSQRIEAVSTYITSLFEERMRYQREHPLGSRYVGPSFLFLGSGKAHNLPMHPEFHSRDSNSALDFVNGLRFSLNEQCQLSSTVDINTVRRAVQPKRHDEFAAASSTASSEHGFTIGGPSLGHLGSGEDLGHLPLHK